MTEASIPTLVLGASGYVGAEVLRLLALHPVLRVVGAFSRGEAGRRVAEAYPHLEGRQGGLRFQDPAELLDCLEGEGTLAIFSCLPHGATAHTLSIVLKAARKVGREVVIVDLSADFRYAKAEDYEAVYGAAHGAPELLEQFYCGVPDLEAETPERHLAHPGCFTTAVSLAGAPLVRTGLVEGALAVSAITGSTGSGREPGRGTHHPERHGNLRAYKPLDHRHRPEMETFIGRFAGQKAEVAFVPHSGPFARGIHATLHASLSEERSLDELVALYREAYAASPSITVRSSPPGLKEVVGSNRCHLGVAVSGRRVVITSVIDNLVKGAAGGGLHWMNRRLGLPAEMGLEIPAVGF